MALNNRLLLLVEDNAGDEEMTLRGLRKTGLTNCKIQVVRDGQEALDWLFRDGAYASDPDVRQPDLILLDLSLPRINGMEVLQRIRSEARLALTPVVIFTSSLEQADLLKGYSNGANSYVQKPVQYEKFMEAVRQLGAYWINLNETA